MKAKPQGAINTLRPLTHSSDSAEKGLAMQATRCQHPDGCDHPVKSNGWCGAHSHRIMRYGDPGAAYVAPPLSVTRKWFSGCIIDGCEKPVRARGWCSTHYARWQKHGDPLFEPPPRPKVCSVADCANPCQARGLCPKHYMRWKATGDPLVTRTPGRRAGPGHHLRKPVVGMAAAHSRVKSMYGKAAEHPCLHCGSQAKDWAYGHSAADERSSPEGYRYSLNPFDYIPLCRPCHRAFDAPYRKARRDSA